MRRRLRRRHGMNALQSVLLVGTGLFILTGVRAAWTASQGEFRENADQLLAGADQPAGDGTAANNPGQTFTDYRDLVRFAEDRGFTVTSTTGGTHNPGSAHGQGRAIDVRTRDMTSEQIDALIRDARNAGLTVRDERTHPPGQAVWTGPHIHIQIPRP